MIFKIMKQVTDEAGNIGFQVESSFEGSADEALQHIEALSSDGVVRQAELDLGISALVVGAP